MFFKYFFFVTPFILSELKNNKRHSCLRVFALAVIVIPKLITCSFSLLENLSGDEAEHEENRRYKESLEMFKTIFFS